MEDLVRGVLMRSLPSEDGGEKPMSTMSTSDEDVPWHPRLDRLVGVVRFFLILPLCGVSTSAMACFLSPPAMSAIACLLVLVLFRNCDGCRIG